MMTYNQFSGADTRRWGKIKNLLEKASKMGRGSMFTKAAWRDPAGYFDSDDEDLLAGMKRTDYYVRAMADEAAEVLRLMHKANDRYLDQKIDLDEYRDLVLDAASLDRAHRHFKADDRFGMFESKRDNLWLQANRLMATYANRVGSGR